MRFLVIGSGKEKCSDEIKNAIIKLDYDYILISGDNQDLDFFDNLGRTGFLIYGEKKIEKSFTNLTLLKRRKTKIKENFNILGLSGLKSYSGNQLLNKMNKRKNEKWSDNLHLLLRSTEKAILLTYNPPYNTKFDKKKGDDLLREHILLHKPLISIFSKSDQGKEILGETVLVNPGSLDKGQFALLDIDDKIDIEFFN